MRHRANMKHSSPLRDFKVFDIACIEEGDGCLYHRATVFPSTAQRFSEPNIEQQVNPIFRRAGDDQLQAPQPQQRLVFPRAFNTRKIYSNSFRAFEWQHHTRRNRIPYRAHMY